MEYDERVRMQKGIDEFLANAKLEIRTKESTSGADESFSIEADRDKVQLSYRVRFNRLKDIPLIQKIRSFFL